SCRWAKTATTATASTATAATTAAATSSWSSENRAPGSWTPLRSGTDDVGPLPIFRSPMKTRSEVGSTSFLEFFTGRGGRAEDFWIGSEAGVGAWVVTAIQVAPV